VQTFREKVGFGIDLPHDIVNMATQELARHRDRAGGQSRDLVRGLARDLIDRRGIDDGVDEADLFGFASGRPMTRSAKARA